MEGKNGKEATRLRDCKLVLAVGFGAAVNMLDRKTVEQTIVLIFTTSK